MKVLVERAFAFSRLVSYAVWKEVPITTVPAALSILAFSRASLQGHDNALLQMQIGDYAVSWSYSLEFASQWMYGLAVSFVNQ